MFALASIGLALFLIAMDQLSKSGGGGGAHFGFFGWVAMGSLLITGFGAYFSTSMLLANKIVFGIVVAILVVGSYFPQVFQALS